MSSFKKENIPNFISVFRILLVPVYILLFFDAFGKGDLGFAMFSSGITFIVAGVSDALDGFLARRNHWVSDVGKLLDPLADKLMELAVAVSLAVRFGEAFVFLAVIVIAKEIVMIVGAYLMMSKSQFVVFSVWYGKLATLIWYVLICMMHFFPAFRQNTVLCNAVCIVLILMMIMAFMMYLLNYSSEILNTKAVIIQEKNIKHEERVEKKIIKRVKRVERKKQGKKP